MELTQKGLAILPGVAGLRSWAEGLEFAVQKGLRYERWWEARLPLEEVRRPSRDEQREKGREALEWLRKLPACRAG